MRSILKLCQEKEPQAIMMARRDFAKVTGQEVVENPYWFKNMETGEFYYSIYGCIGWPERVEGHFSKVKGYAAILAILKRSDRKPEAAVFKVVDEIEDKGVENLIMKCFKLREKWGFGLHPDLLPVWFGDHLQRELIVAKMNTKLVEKGKDDQAFIVSPPNDFEYPNAFDNYMDQLRTVLGSEKRLYLGNSNVIKKRLESFSRNDPVITAVGGLIYTLLMRQPWLEQATPSVFQLPEF